MSRVNIDAAAFTDIRFEKLARRLDLSDADHARGKMERVWLDCTIRERVTLSDEDLDIVFGVDGAAAAVVDVDLGERIGDGSIRIKGCKGRTDWLAKKRANGRKFGKKGGRPAKGSPLPDEKGSAKGDPFRKETPPAPAPAPAPALEHNVAPTPSKQPARKEPSQEAYTLADYLRRKILDAKPDHRLGKGANSESKWPESKTRRDWAKTADLMRSRDGRAWRRSGELVAWLWGPNLSGEFSFVVESMAALRDKWDRIDTASTPKKAAAPSTATLLDGYEVTG